ncbi:MAG: class I mannose-6-phosphate isomerase [Bacteroidia bacterium]
MDIREGKSDPQESQFPEDWIASTTIAVNKGREEFIEEGLSKVIFEGKSYLLRELIERYPSQMVGEEHFKQHGAHTRFLLKFLDSSIRLHLQAHPTIAFAQQHLNSNSGKTEAYVILSVREEVSEPYIYLGFQNVISSEEFKEAVSNQDLDKLLPCFEKIPIKAGDVFIVPGGMPHAIGEGVLMIEIMEPTDFAVRLEFERGGIVLPEEARFMGRGVGFAADMINFDIKSVPEVIAQHFCTPQLLDEQEGGKEYSLIGPEQTTCFSVNRLDISVKFVKSSDSFYAGIVSKGNGYMLHGDSKTILNEGDRFFVSYCATDVHYIGENDFELVLTFPPK